jgi:hypothetical protein
MAAALAAKPKRPQPVVRAVAVDQSFSVEDFRTKQRLIVRNANAQWVATGQYRRLLGGPEGSLIAGWERFGFEFDEELSYAEFLSSTANLGCRAFGPTLWQTWTGPHRTTVGLEQIMPRIRKGLDLFHANYVRGQEDGDAPTFEGDCDEEAFVQLCTSSDQEVSAEDRMNARMLFIDLVGQRAYKNGAVLPAARINAHCARKVKRMKTMDSVSTMAETADLNTDASPFASSFMSTQPPGVQEALDELAALARRRESWLAAPRWTRCLTWWDEQTTRQNIQVVRAVLAARDAGELDLTLALAHDALSEGACRRAAEHLRASFAPASSSELIQVIDEEATPCAPVFFMRGGAALIYS